MKYVIWSFLLLTGLYVQGQNIKIDYNAIKKSPIKRDFIYDGDQVKDASLTIINTTKSVGSNLEIYVDQAVTPMEPAKRKVETSSTTFSLGHLEGDKEITLEVKEKGKEMPLATLRFAAAHAATVDAEDDKPEPERPDFFAYIKKYKTTLNLQQHYILGDNCCDNCPGCEQAQFKVVDRIIYNPVNGITYFLPKGNAFDNFCRSPEAYNKHIVNNRNRIKLRANDPLLFQVINLNADLYDIELIDTSFLLYNESNPMIENLLLGKAEGFDLHGRADSEAETGEYLRVRAGLVLLNAEMQGLLENLRLNNRFLHNCVTQKKKEARTTIDNYTSNVLGENKYPNISFFGLVDIFLDPASKVDSALNTQLKEKYKQLLIDKYELAYRFTVPENDQMDCTLKILRKNNSPYPSLLNPKLPTQHAYIRNFFKVDVSAGLYYGFIDNPEYSLRADSIQVPVAGGGHRDSLGQRIVTESAVNGEVGFASFLHFYYKFGTTVNIGGILGAGLRLDDKIQPRYFTGLSFMFGRNNRLSINTGVMWGQQKVLSNQYIRKSDDFFNWIPVSEESLNYVNRLKSGGFVSISYNLPFLKRKPAEAKTETAPSTEKPKENDEKKSDGENEEK